MSAAHLMGFMYRYDPCDDLAAVIYKGKMDYRTRTGMEATQAAVHPGTVVPRIDGIEIVERRWMRKNHVLVGRLIDEG